MKKYILVQWTFNYGAWSRAIAEAVEVYGYEGFARMMGCTVATLKQWQIAAPNEGYPYPNMTNFVKLIRLIDMDPRDFFHTEDVE